MNESLVGIGTGSASDKKTVMDRAPFLFDQLAKFHQIREPAKWVVSDDVLAFLPSKLKAGMQAWKRLMIVKGLFLYNSRHARQHQAIYRASFTLGRARRKQSVQPSKAI